MIQIDIIEPATSEVLEQYFVRDEQPNNLHIIPTHIHSVIAMSTSHVGMFNRLNMTSTIVGVPNFDDLCHPIDNEKAQEVGYMQNTNPEVFVKLNPDVIFYSGYDLNHPILEKLHQAHLKTFLFYDWRETHPLGRAEWIKVLGVLFHKEKKANRIFEQIASNYNATKRKLAQTETNTTMFAGTYFSGVFNAPAGESYMAQLFKDAHLNYVFSKTNGTGSLSLTLEKVITQNKATDYWLNAATGTTLDLLQQSKKFHILKAVKTKHLYSYFKNKNCFFEEAPISPDIVLKDLGKIFYPQLFPKYQLHFYEKLE